MRAKLSTDGYLSVLRSNGGYKRQVCPFREKFCGDSCPHFREVEIGCDYEHQVYLTCGVGGAQFRVESRGGKK